MMSPAAWWQLEPRAAALVRDFLFHPAVYVHPDRLADVWPGGADLQPTRGADDAALSRALMQVFEIPTDVELDAQHPLHQVALLPYEGLARLARRVELECLGRRLRRVILRSELQALAGRLNEDDWRVVMAGGIDGGRSQHALDHAREPVDGENPAEAASMPMQELAHQLDTLGWQVLEQAFSQLPAGLRSRAVLKLPMRPNPSNPDASASKALVERVYAACADEWDADWHEAWLALAEHQRSGMGAH
jgi:hypothetical protein